MSKNKVLFRVLLVCVCVILIAGCFGITAMASAKSVLQVNSATSSASLKDGVIQVALADNDVFTYNEILDLSTASKNVPLLNMQFHPTQIGTADATKVKLRFTDLYDENNYITISLNSLTDDWASGHVYVTAGAADQPQIGVENAGDPSNSKPHINDIYGFGAAVDYSLAGLPKSAEDTHLTLYFDYAEKALYADRETYTHAKQLLVDLDDASYFGTDLWEGFTTGQVKLSVFASNYQSSTCNFSISTINGNSQLKDNDESAPIISVNSGYEQDALPTALVGKPYPIFPATAIDGCDGKVDVTAAVYFNHTEVPVENGAFTPTETGVYTIKYTSQDRSGNTSAVSVAVNAVVGDALQVTLQNTISETDIGIPVQVLSGINCTGASGNVSHKVSAKHAATGEQLEIDPQTYSFTPMTEGDWEITLTAQDYISTVVKTFTVKVNRTSQPQVYSTVAIPDYFIQGATYQLPVLYGYDFSSGKGVLTPMEVYVTENGSSETAVANGKYTPANAGAVTVTYRLTVEGKVCEKTYTATVVKVKTILNTVSLNKYFVDPTGAATASSTSTKSTYAFKKDTKLHFVNFVQVKQFTFAFQTGTQKAYNKISVYLTDVISGKQIKLSYNRTENGAAFSINDSAPIALTTAFDSLFTLTFSDETDIVIPETGKNMKVKTFLDGSEFTGFTDSVARFTVELSEVTGSSQFVVQTLNGQKLNNATKDSTAPQFIADSISGTIEKGKKLQLNGAFVYDVLDPIATVTLKVTDPDGIAVTDDNGTVLNGTQDASKDSSITMEKLGTYTIFYTVTDGKKNTGRHIYTITVTDGEGPTITLLEHATSANPGDTVAIAAIQVEDNLTADCTVASYVFNPEGVKIPVTNGTFTASMQGVYTVKYMAFDDDSNYSFASYEVSTLPEKTEKANYLSQSLSLGSDLTLHLWGNVPDGYASSISGTLAYDDVTDDFKLSQLTPNTDGLYHIQAELAAAQMTEQVDLTLQHNTLGQIIQRQYSIRDYLAALIQGDYDQTVKDLSLELLNMGAWAQKYFHYNENDLANTGFESSPTHAVPEEIPTIHTNGKVDGIAVYAASVRLLTQTVVRFYFDADNGVEDYTFTMDGAEYTPVEKNGLYYIETPGINPQNMHDVITVSVTDGSSTLSVEYAPIWYFIRTYNKTTDATTKGLMAAAYSYYKAAEAYEHKLTSGQVTQPEAPTGEGVNICLDLLLTTLGNSTDPVEIRFYAHDYTGSVHNGYTDKVTITAGEKTTVKLNAEKYMVDGVIPEGLGIAIFGGPTWDAKLEDGTQDRHTLTISNAWLKGAYEKRLDLRTAVVATGNEGTGYTDANSAGQAKIVGSSIVISDGYCYDAHKIAVNGQKSKTYVCMDMMIYTLCGNWSNDIEVRFYRYDYEGTVHNYYQDKVLLKAGAVQTVKLNLDTYLVNGELPGIGVAIFGGPAWDAKLEDNTTPNRHTVTISNVRLEGGQEQAVSLYGATVATGNNSTGYTDANGSGAASVADGKIVITNGFQYDGHKITFGSGEAQEQTYICLDMQIDTLGGNWAKNIEMRFYAYNFQGNPHEVYTDKISIQAGEQITVKLNADKYLINGELPGIGIGIFGGPEWNTQISDGVYDRHTLTISGVRLEGGQSKTYDLSNFTCISGTGETGYTVANGSGVGAFVDGVYQITNGFCYDCHKITFD